MNGTTVSSQPAGDAAAERDVTLRLELVLVAVSDVDRAKAFYEDLGWRLDADISGKDGFRIVQLTPPGSPASMKKSSPCTPRA